MPGFTSISNIADSDTEGKTLYASWRKSPTQTTARGFWFDLSMSPGNPPPQYYAASPGVSVAMAQSTDGGIYHGKPITPSTLYLRKMLGITATATVVPCSMILCDYLLYYPFIDESSTDPQPLTTNVTLPRYADGKGVQIMAVVVAGQTGGVTFSVNYTNSDGISDRTSATVTLCTQAAVGTIATTAPATAGCNGPFIPLAKGDTGVRSIESITMNSADVGLLTLVLVKPLAQFSIRGIDAPVELDYFLNCGGTLPVIQDDAFLMFLCSPGGTIAGSSIMGVAEFAWR